METRQNTNDFAKGMTNIPSDSVCQDDSVAAEWNMIFRNGEHCTIQAPINLDIFKTGSFFILHIHKVSNRKHYVGVEDNGNLVYCIEGEDTITIGEYADYDKETQVTSIGNTLIVNAKGKELRYFLWKPDNMTYRFIGNRLPKPEISFVLGNTIGGNIIASLRKSFINTSPFEGILSYACKEIAEDNVRWCYVIVDDTKEEDAKALFIGLYSKCKNDVANANMFCNPFSIRYALRLFDGSYANITSPVILMPSVRSNCIYSIDGHTFSGKLKCSITGYPIYFKYSEDLTEWRDIIKDISVFITNPVDVYDTYKLNYDSHNPYIDYISTDFSKKNEGFTPYGMVYNKNVITWTNPNDNELRSGFECKEEGQIITELSEQSVFYKIFKIGIKGSDSWQDSREYIRSHDIENLTTLEQLEHDDYYSNCPITAESIYMYNKRLHLSNVSRGFSMGGTSFLPLHTIEYTIVDRIQINTNEGVKVVIHEYNTRENPTLYFYYPDTRAFHVDRCIETESGNLGIITIGEKQCSFDLKPHQFLNGSYYIMETLPNEEDNLTWVTKSDIQYTIVEDESFNKESVEPENLSNEVWVSEVNNPFVFNAQGVNTVGNGEIIGIISNTRAISQGQFGQFPLFCFTTDGVWTLQISSEGTYSSAHPISREICNNKDSITATDNLVFFTSEKGLMMINGADVSCVSSQLNGKTYVPLAQELVLYITGKIEPVSFVDFIKKCKIAYDYRDNLLWIVNRGFKHCFLLSIESGAYAMTTLGGYPVNVINDYPDTLIEVNCGQTEPEYMTFSLINRPNINDDERRISSFIISRPVKIGDQNSLKTPTMIRYIGNNNQKAAIRMRLFASDDLVNWVRINSLRGRGFKYYKYNFIFEDLLPTDTFSGVTERWQFKYLSKFR